VDSISFKARARTIDHLGREQIADAPTAVSELWKNSYDAYARNVALHVFDGEIPTAAISDDGHGMSRDEFVGRWLVIGTDSKLSETEASESDRNGLPARIRQGQKGIGRLSCAALGHLALVVTKRASKSFVAALIDWRLFENPYLLLDDISLPVFEFSNNEQLLKNLGGMRDVLIGNLWGHESNLERKKRIEDAWRQFDELEARQSRDSTRRSIEEVIISDVFLERQLETWSAWNGKADHGTTVLLAGLNFDLEALLAIEGPDAQDDTVTGARRRCFQTLSSFTDPFNKLPNIQNEFHYAIDIWHRDDPSSFLSNERELDYSNFDVLEHIVDGSVDEEGVFRGRIKAFGEWLDAERSVEPIRVRRVLHRLGYRFRLHRSDLPGSPDITLPKYGLCIFVHGCFWHRHAGCSRASNPASNKKFWATKFDTNRKRDRKVQRELARLRWTKEVIWECETRDPEKLIRRLERIILHAEVSLKTASPSVAA